MGIGNRKNTPTGIRIQLVPGVAEVLKLTRDVAIELHERRRSTCEVLGIDKEKVLSGWWDGHDETLKRGIERVFEQLDQLERNNAKVKSWRVELLGYSAWLDQLTRIMHAPEPVAAFKQMVRLEHAAEGRRLLRLDAETYLRDHYLEAAEHTRMLDLARAYGLGEDEVERAYEEVHPQPFMRESSALQPPGGTQARLASTLPPPSPRREPTPSDPLGLVGELLANRYRVEQFVGDGHASRVYRGVDISLARPVAIKCIKVPPMLTQSARESILASLKRGAEPLAVLSGLANSIVNVYETASIVTPTGDFCPYLVLEWLEGCTLQTVLEERSERGESGFTLHKVMELLEGAARGLSVAHHDGIFHGDINPRNLFLVQSHGVETLKILDFGIASALQSAAVPVSIAVTQAAYFAFSGAHAAPEQFDPKFGHTGPWTDTFSLARVAVAMLVGSATHHTKTLEQHLITAIRADPRPTPGSYGVMIDPRAEAVFRKALAVQPADRFQNAKELFSALRSAATSSLSLPPPEPQDSSDPQSSSSPKRSDPPDMPLPRPKGGRWWLLGLLGVPLLAIAAIPSDWFVSTLQQGEASKTLSTFVPLPVPPLLSPCADLSEGDTVQVVRLPDENEQKTLPPSSKKQIVKAWDIWIVLKVQPPNINSKHNSNAWLPCSAVKRVNKQKTY